VAVNNVIEEEEIDDIEKLLRFTKDEKMSGWTLDELYSLSMYTASTSQKPSIELGNTASTYQKSSINPSIDLDNNASTSLLDLGNPSIDLGTSQKPSIDPSIDLGNTASLIDLDNTASLIDLDIDLGNTASTSLINSDIDLGNTASTSLIDIGSTKPDEKPLTM
jgi:hypothetical protein